MTETLAIIKYMDIPIVTADPKDIAISVRKRIATYGNIQRRNIIRLRRSTKAALMIKLKDGLITALGNTLSSILLTIKEMIVRT